MCDAEVLARHAVEKITGDRLARREGNGVHEAVELVPVLITFDDTARLTVMNAHVDYPAVKDAAIDDMLEIIKLRRTDSGP